MPLALPLVHALMISHRQPTADPVRDLAEVLARRPQEVNSVYIHRTAGSTPSAPGSASPAAAPVSPAPSSAAPAGATGSTSDKKLCESAKKAGNDMKDAFATAATQSVGMPSPAQMKRPSVQIRPPRPR